MTVVTLGLYQIYWFYKHWDRVGTPVTTWPRRRGRSSRSSSAIRSFRRIVDSTHAAGVKTGVPAWLLTVGFLLPSVLSRLPDPAYLLGFLGLLPLLAAQRIATAVAIAQGSTEDRDARLTQANWAWIGTLVVIFVLLVIAFALGILVPAPPA